MAKEVFKCISDAALVTLGIFLLNYPESVSKCFSFGGPIERFVFLDTVSGSMAHGGEHF